MEEELHIKPQRTLVVIPAFNEEGRVGAVVRRVRLAAPFATVLVVDDASRDLTGSEARQAGARVVRHPFNLGYGAAVKTGLMVAVSENFPQVVHMDGDGQHEPDSIGGLLDAVRRGGVDVAVGSRFLGGGSYRVPLLRRAGMLVFGRIVSMATGRRLTDPTSGFAALSRRAVVLFSRSDHYPADFPDADVIIMAHRSGLRVSEVPVKMYESPSDKKSMHDGLAPLYYIFKMFLSVFLALVRRKPPESRDL